MNDDEIKRYARHLVLKEIGGPGQQRLKAASALIVGAGGLGGPAALYLAAAGIGKLTLIDDDVVSLDNLQRQIQFSETDLDLEKTGALRDRLVTLNSGADIAIETARLDQDNAETLAASHDIILDGTDNFETRFTVNAACVKAGKPLVSGAVGRWTGQVGVFAAGIPEHVNTACYQCFVPAIPPDAETCERAGIVGALTGIIGSAMALEAIKWITEAAPRQPGKLWIHDALGFTSRTLDIPRDPACPACGN